MPFETLDAHGSCIMELEATDARYPTARVEDRILILRGGLVDNVQLICKEYVPSGASAEELEAVYVSWRKFARDAVKRKELEERDAYEYVQDHTKATERHWIRFLSVMSDKADDLKGYSRSDSSFEKRRRKEREANRDRDSTPFSQLRLNYKLARSYLLPPSHSPKQMHGNRRIHDLFQRIGVGRRLCITMRGSLALIPAEAEKGDLFGLFHGASFPYVLRKHGEEEDHVLVGEAWVPRYSSAYGERLAKEEWGIKMNATIRLC
ncbi:hypothetical protein BU26DRAFT_560531 [Trematosphaeria pertusa]|uniref:Heterokaryon incompatibility domain-containing protein n=1 Tax=Trematosphaeria pertusa TaxID=390896 RepID=A0A6A6IVH9_9PLEO|nr:uncharacterized protein BU26DRAFT_560531 [Trematosphaeria pertusa]KAF2253203.1 hypothetical protein BU26DRAFT_560531 [Trematosphaeria pertusa]